MIGRRKVWNLLLSLLVTAFFAVPAFASQSSGTISPSSYAWSEKAGWINFGATNGGVHISDSALTGYAWSEHYGWIHLNPTMGGVKNTSAGVLSGYAWSFNLGWINFSGVTINYNGYGGTFSGQASGDNTGVINFSCARCSVLTDWRPEVNRDVTVAPVSGGPGLPSGAYSPPAAPFSLIVNNGIDPVTSAIVNVSLIDGANSAYAWVSEDPQFIVKAEMVTLSTSTHSANFPFTLSAGEGVKTIYAKFCTQYGQCGDLISRTITYSLAVPVPPALPPTPPAVAPGAVVPPPKIGIKEIVFKEIKKLVSSLLPSFKFSLPSITSIPIARYYNQITPWLSYLFKAPPQFKSQIPIETFVARLTPSSMSGKWTYIDPVSLNRFVFAPLPKEFLALEQKFPAMRSTFAQVGINRFSDIQKLSSVQMYLPGLTKAVAFTAPAIGSKKVGGEIGKIPTGEIDAKLLKSLSGVSVDSLSADLKKKVPTGIVFARAAGQLVDLKVALSLTAKGRPEQKISTISGKPLHLTIRPDKPVRQIRGFIVFRSRSVQARAEMKLGDLISSVIFAEPAFAYNQETPVPTEEKLVLTEFVYTDPDHDGLYTADVMSPVPAGEYEIITVMDYEDPDLGSRQVRLITVVDPEGYIYEKVDNKELRVPGAVATLYHFNADTKRYEEWPAKDFQQDNPQITDVRGTYSFLVPGGMYYIKVTAPGYIDYEGKPFPVEDGSGVHMNIEMQTKYWWLKIVDWKTVLLVAVALLLLYNFYKDRTREKKN